MLLTNTAPYAKNYRKLAIGKVLLILSKKLMLIIYDDVCVVYNNGCLKGVLVGYRYIIESATSLGFVCETQWTKNQICGFVIPYHRVPFYYDNDSISIYGFKVTQYSYDMYTNNKLDDNVYNKLRCQI